jgi:hypothetical protein
MSVVGAVLVTMLHTSTFLPTLFHEQQLTEFSTMADCEGAIKHHVVTNPATAVYVTPRSYLYIDDGFMEDKTRTGNCVLPSEVELYAKPQKG